MYENIVIGIDSSEFSRAAVIETANWIKKHGGKLTLVHGVYFDEEEFSNAPDQLDRRVDAAKGMCEETESMIASEFGIEANTVVRGGEPPDIIAAVADELKADLIAMGTHGRRGLKRIIMGSVTSSLIVNAPCDVLVVKKPCVECTGAFSSILLPFDGSEFSRHALQRACQLSKADSAQITVLYVIPRYEEMIGFFKTESIKDSLAGEAEKIMDSAKEIAAGQDVSIKTIVDEGHPSDRIIEHAADLKSDLIVMGTYGWRGVNKAIMGSNTERVLIHASCPILIVR